MKPLKYYYLIYENLLLIGVYCLVVGLSFYYLGVLGGVIVLIGGSFPYSIISLYLQPHLLDSIRVAGEMYQNMRLINNKEIKPNKFWDFCLKYIIKFHDKAREREKTNNEYILKIATGVKDGN